MQGGILHLSSAERQRMGFAERRAEGSGHGGSDARASNAAGAYSFQSRPGVSCRATGHSPYPTEPSGDMDLHFFAPQNAATESGNAGIEIVLGERFPSVTVFGISLAPGGHQTMKRYVFPADHSAPSPLESKSPSQHHAELLKDDRF
jgi:hypothetical protein